MRLLSYGSLLLPFDISFGDVFILCICRVFTSVNPLVTNGIFAASHLGLLCLPMSHKKDARLVGVKVAEWPPFGKELLTRSTVCSRCIMSI